MTWRSVAAAIGRANPPGRTLKAKSNANRARTEVPTKAIGHGQPGNHRAKKRQELKRADPLKRRRSLGAKFAFQTLPLGAGSSTQTTKRRWKAKPVVRRCDHPVRAFLPEFNSQEAVMHAPGRALPPPPALPGPPSAPTNDSSRVITIESISMLPLDSLSQVAPSY